MLFSYRSSQVVPQKPLPLGDTVVFAETASMTMAGHPVAFVLTRRSYPDPPLDFGMSEDAKTLWARYGQHLTGKEPLPSMAYFVATYINGCGDGRKYFGATESVRIMLGRLSSTKGDRLSARKAVTEGPLTALEEDWLRAAVRELIRRAGQYAVGREPAALTMTDLPQLP
jgi:hypothetical protein